MSGAGLSARSWGTAPGGAEITLYTLKCGDVRASVMNYGGVLVGLWAPDRRGQVQDITLGYDEAAPYLSRATSAYFGALIGRCANRVACGQLTLDGQTHQLEVNNGPHSLHGGEAGFDQRLWTAEPDPGTDRPALRLRYVSPDGEGGYPGTLSVSVTYSLSADGLNLLYRAETDAPTVVNLTNHTYWNLSGDAARDVLGHEVRVNASDFTPIDDTLIPTGELRPVAGTAFDFRTPRVLGEALRAFADDSQLRFAGGYDHNFALGGSAGELKEAAEVHDPVSGRVLTAFTTEPGMQLYSGNFLDGSLTGKGGRRYARHWALCLETQHFPDSPHQPSFPSVRLDPGERFESHTRYGFSVR